MKIKKVLLLNSPDADFLESFLVMGLVKLLGEENVVIYPPKLSYYGKVHEYPHLQDPGKTGVTGPFEFFPALKDPFACTLDQISSCDLVITTTRTKSLEVYAKLKQTGCTLPKMVMVDGEDHQYIRGGLIHQHGPFVYFKRESLPAQQTSEGDTKIYSLPLSSYVWESAFAEEAKGWVSAPKKYDVVCVVGNTHPYRREVVSALQKMNLPNSLIGIDGEERTSMKEHLRRLALAKIGVSIRGHGEDTVRHWEIPSFNTLLLTDDLNIVHPNPFTTETAAFYANPEECVDKVEYFLQYGTVREKITAAGNQHCLKYHTATARAAYLLEVAESHM